MKNFDVYIELDNYIISVSNFKFYITAKNEFAKQELYLTINNTVNNNTVIDGLPYEDSLTLQSKECEWITVSLNIGSSNFFVAFLLWQKFLMSKEPKYQQEFINLFNSLTFNNYE